MGKYLFIISILIVGTIPSLWAYAHGLGQTLQSVHGNYTIDVDYDVLGNIEAQYPVTFDFNLLLSTTQEPVMVDRVWLRIDTGERTPIFISNLADPAFGPISALVMFPYKGEYSLTARYYQGETEIAQATFPLTVIPPLQNTEGSNLRMLITGALFGIMLSGAVFFGVQFFRRKRV